MENDVRPVDANELLKKIAPMGWDGFGGKEND